ncbi:hypothetical protein [Planctomicrobium piriforme]|uniref:Uncharacterized protein n=1 Tax=Planctomicrobium piriforme TaxID=1576369 RepID=A0A1I3PEP7_9PLAN|nr:hypothetical protein [Planctomicrobium piriforme]SFJ19891.1 hypothetical protein SAMN05421753_116128 [Planctomicrobium piriforme]
MARYLFCLLLVGANALIAGLQVNTAARVVEPCLIATACSSSQSVHLLSHAVECRLPGNWSSVSAAWAMDVEEDDFSTRLKLVGLHLVPGGARTVDFAVRLRQGALALNCTQWSDRNLPLLV